MILPRLSAAVCAGLIAVLPAQAFGAPQVFWASDPVGPGEEALVVGDAFGSSPTVAITRLTDGANAAPAPLDSAAGIETEIAQATDQSLKFKIPDAAGEGVYRMTLSDGKHSVTQLLNAPVIYWAQGDQGVGASPGGWVRVFGRDISLTKKSTELRLISARGAARTLSPGAASLWDATFNLPADIPAGTYQLRLYNGRGDRDAWRDAGSLHVIAPSQWPDRRFDVHAYGAIGNGTTDDTNAVQAAVAAAGQNGGGVVYFPRGRYLLKAAISVPRFVTIRGARRDLVDVVWPDFDDPPIALIQGTNHFAVQDLTLYASNYRNLIASDLQATAAGEAGNVRIQRVTARAVIYRGHLKPDEVDARLRQSLKWSSGGGDTLRLGGENLVVTDNDLYGSGRSLYLYRPRGALVSGNHFYNGRWGWYCLSGVDGLIFEDNEITGADLMSSGGGINTLGGMTYSQNVYFAKNKLSLMHGWDREAMTSDGAGGFYYGHVSSVDGRRLILLDEQLKPRPTGDRWSGAGVFVLAGRGMGQFGQVAGFDKGQLLLDRKWSVRPDASSTVTVVPMQQNYLFVNNEFTDAGVAIQYYGTSINHVAVGNKSVRTGGFSATGRWYHQYQPSWYCQFLDNAIVEGNIYRSGANGSVSSGEAMIGIFGVQRPPNTAPLTLGSVLRGNRLDSNAHIEINGGTNRMAPGVRDVIVENNRVENSDVGISVSAGVAGLWQGGNEFLKWNVDTAGHLDSAQRRN